MSSKINVSAKNNPAQLTPEQMYRNESAHKGTYDVHFQNHIGLHKIHKTCSFKNAEILKYSPKN